ncbi:Gti1/Pac2 family-domain-containing protein [Phanerochaete sordida]|uniref:Gti1/Pac2 family-domain-containing protein n=1 Tax=Phanerochaete sordida TaxID=48140 RepID=A0A9P3LFL6_9APHY|nr:Gti1/Pac2 family-domain-containing protein [Phanerochaete sordida]
MVQRPTCTQIRVRSIADCNVIFYAVSLGLLPLVSRRLSIEERRAIHSGCVFVWEERAPTLDMAGAQDGLERWTDSRRWGASRLTKDFLYYQEKLPDVGDAALYAAMYHNRLIKQTYSVFVETQEGRRKWHLVAYCSPETGHHLHTVDDVPELAALRHQVPDGKFQAARYSKSRARAEDADEHPGAAPAPAHAPVDAPPRGGQPYYRRSPPSASPPSSSRSAPAAPPSGAREAPLAVPPRAPSAGVRLPKAPQFPFRDPGYVRDNCVKSAPVAQMQNVRLFSPDAPKDMAPLLYMRQNPYNPRHPLDNDALRALDSVS